MAVVGVVIITLDKEFVGSVYGICLVIFCSFIAAFYKVFKLGIILLYIFKVLFKKFNGNATLGQVSLFMTSLGLLNMIINILPTTILILLKYDYIEWNYVPWAALFATAILSLSKFYKFNLKK